MRDRTKLKVFELADRLVVSIYQRSGSFPISERFGLQSQIRRAAVSIAANECTTLAKALNAVSRSLRGS